MHAGIGWDAVPVKSIKIIDSKTKMTYQLTVADGQIELTEVDR